MNIEYRIQNTGKIDIRLYPKPYTRYPIYER